MLLDNKLVDYWFDLEVVPYLINLNLHNHDLTPSLIKLQLLTNNYNCFSYENCIVIGEPAMSDSKDFIVHYWYAKTLSQNVYTEFFNDLRHYGFSNAWGYNSESQYRLHQIKSKQVLQKRYNLFIDLHHLQYKKDVLNQPITLMPSSHIDYWWSKLDLQSDRFKTPLKLDYIKQQIRKNELLCYTTKDCVIIGFMLVKPTHKQFFIYLTVGKNLKSDIADFFHELELNGCRYVKLLSDYSQSRLYDRFIRAWDSSGCVRKKIHSTFLLT